jgi:FlaA1/EpsC-like NDP-sugar epimerase
VTKYGTILITGGTGTFGNAFVTHALRDDLADRIIILSRDELKQQKMRARLGAFNPRMRYYLGNVRDQERLERAFQGVDVVIHAAAYKQLPRSFLDFDAFKKVNIDGTENVCLAAHKAGVKRVIFLSSDKACASSSPYGSTKSVAEWTAISSNILGPCRVTCLRYGNVKNSRGSVLEVWRRQEREGQPFAITDERMTRFWMTIEQAVDLTLTALQYGRGGEIFIPGAIERGPVVDLFRDHYPDAEYEVIGKAGYEKLAEELISAEEADRAIYCGAFYVLLPPPDYVRWEPIPYGMREGEGVPVSPGFVYRSDQ